VRRPASSRNGSAIERGESSVNLGEAFADTPIVLKWRLKLRFAFRDPAWRSDLNLRVGLPLLGSAGAVVFALLISRL
jgi:hypothetical protein